MNQIVNTKINEGKMSCGWVIAKLVVQYRVVLL
jgi:hypothetical protein